MTSAEQTKRQEFFSQVGGHLKKLYDHVRHQLGYFESVGDLAPGELKPEDVVDATLIRAYREWTRGEAERAKNSSPQDMQDMETRLIQLATRQLQSEVKRLRSERGSAVPIEEDVPETPPEEKVKTLGEEILYFYQPDEDLKMEDVLPDLSIPTPEQVAELREFRRCVNAASAALPGEWRRALQLRYVDGRTLKQTAAALRKSEREVERVIEYARRYLRQRLVESGCAFNEDHAAGRKKHG
jgi:RNA polymerase sigma factor (sigma-70 family)